jgi:hypothetical protein
MQQATEKWEADIGSFQFLIFLCFGARIDFVDLV